MTEAKKMKIVNVPKGKTIPYGWKEIKGDEVATVAMYCSLRAPSRMVWDKVYGLNGAVAETIKSVWVVIRKMTPQELGVSTKAATGKTKTVAVQKGKIVDVPTGRRVPYGWTLLGPEEVLQSVSMYVKSDTGGPWEPVTGLEGRMQRNAAKWGWTAIRKMTPEERKLAGKARKKTPASRSSSPTWRGLPVKDEAALLSTPNDLPEESAYDDLWDAEVGKGKKKAPVRLPTVAVPTGTEVPPGWVRLDKVTVLRKGMYLRGATPSGGNWFQVDGWSGKTLAYLDTAYPSLKLEAIHRLKFGINLRVVVSMDDDQRDEGKNIVRAIEDALSKWSSTHDVSVRLDS
jgi:hypothetical protein